MITYLNTPEQLFRQRFHFSLPQSSTIENFQKSPLFTSDEPYFCMKVNLDPNDYLAVENNFIEYFSENKGSDKIAPFPFFENTCPWWDMDKNSIIFQRHAYLTGKRAITKDVYAFIVKNQDQIYLYIAA